MTNGIFFIAPKWCIIGLYALEAYVTSGTPQLTIITGDRIPGANAIITRDQKVLASVVPLADPTLVDALGMTLTSQITAADGAVTENKADLPLTSATANIPGFIEKYLKAKQINPTANISAQIIGRPACIDIISEFVVPAVVQTAVPVVLPPVPIVVPSTAVTGPGSQIQQQQFNTPAGFTSLPTTQIPQQAFNTPVGFVSIPVGPIPQGSQRPTVALDDKQGQRLKDFLNKSCNKSITVEKTDVSIEKMPRVLTAVHRILDRRATGFAGVSDKFLNLSSCQWGAAKSFETRSVGFIPGTQQSLNLSMMPEDVRSIIKGEGKDRLDDQAYGSQIDAVFKEAAGLILEKLGLTTQHAEQNLVPVPVSILDSIPSGPSPAGRSVVVAKTPFIEQIPLAGVIEVTAPITDGRRCIPGLMAKKRE